ncbi:MAG: amino acid-binding protein [Candidatus Methanomethylophilaceae archaeon]|nr:amino acid-binding protein [Candidatus Methanomethylophilaceae archaeon]
MPEENVIIQLSIFVNNEPGRLAAIARTLKESRVNMKAFNLAESAEFGILRAIVDDPEESFEKIRQKGIIVKKTQVIGIVINDAPGSLFEAADVCGREGINIEYGYAYAGENLSAFFIRVDEPHRAVEALKKAGIELVKGTDI